MPITRITIGNKAITTSKTIISAREGVRLDVENSIVRISAETVPTIWEEAFNAWLESGERYVSRINNITPSIDGAFWLHGDECTAYKPLEQITLVQWLTEYAKRADGSVDTKGKTSFTEQPYGSGLEIYDLCPACRTCAMAILLKRKFEWLKMMLNMHKEIILTKDNRRLDYLSENRIEANAQCEEDVKRLGPQFMAAPRMLGEFDPLLNEYVTTVHMWNYVVAKNNMSIEVHTTAESPTGFYVQTKHALPSCNQNQRLECEIEVEPYSVEPDVSVLVTGVTTKFEPFKDSGGVGESDATIKHMDATHKKVTSNFPAATAAGTYVMVAKFIPFIYATLTDAEGNPIDLSNINWDVLVIPEGDETDKLMLGGLISTIKQLTAPTVEDYNNANRYPSRSDSGTNIWKITITWRIINRDGSASGLGDSVSSYFFESMKTRKPIDGLLRDSIWVSDGGDVSGV